MTDNTTARLLGVPWFQAEDYEAFQAVLPHRKWPVTHDAWLRDAEKMVIRSKHQGFTVVRVSVTSGDFAAWCATRGIPVDNFALRCLVHQSAIGANAAADQAA